MQAQLAVAYGLIWNQSVFGANYKRSGESTFAFLIRLDVSTTLRDWASVGNRLAHKSALALVILHICCCGGQSIVA